MYESPSELPVPYYYQNEKNVIIVAANPQTDADTVIRFDLNEILGEKTWSAEILFGTGKGEKLQEKSAEQLSQMEWNINRDKIRQGGLLVLRFRCEE